MNKILSFVMAALCVVMLGACSSDTPENPADGEVKYLTMGEVGVEVLSRMGLDSEVFEAGDVIGLYIRNSKNQEYATGCTNIPVTFDGTKWTMKVKIPITSTDQAYVNAYYPYVKNVTSTTISQTYFSDDATNYKDVMIARCVPGTDAKINLAFERKMVRLNVNIKLGADYAGEGKLNGYQFVAQNCRNYFNNLYLDAASGPTFSTGYYTNTGIAVDRNFTEAPVLNNEYASFSSLIAMYGDSSNSYRTKSMKLNITVDGLNYEVGTFDCSEWEGGHEYTFDINFNVKNTVVTSSMTPWGEGDTYTTNME